MLAGEVLPDTISPYVTTMLVGFGVGIFGHLVRSRWLIVTGIVVILVSIVLFQVAAGTSDDELPPPTPSIGP